RVGLARGAPHRWRERARRDRSKRPPAQNSDIPGGTISPVGSPLEEDSSRLVVAVSMDEVESADHDPRWPVEFDRKAGASPPAVCGPPIPVGRGGGIDRPKIPSLRR